MAFACLTSNNEEAVKFKLLSVAIALPSLLFGVTSCSAASTTPVRLTPVAPAPPPKDDGQPSQGGNGGAQHAAALEQLRSSGLGWRSDRQNSVRIQLPDAEHWTRVRFWGVKSLVGFRYGKEHHEIGRAS